MKKNLQVVAKFFKKKRPLYEKQINTHYLHTAGLKTLP